eukprot:jgi/Ulvmu1/1494/UM011_0224.1
MAKTKKEDKEKAVRDICDVMRRRGGVEWRSAIVHEERKEFFRGKDMLRFFEANTEKLDGISEPGGTVESRVSEACEIMMKMDLIIACDRFYKKPHPGRKRLVKFPRKLESRTRGQQLWDPEAFYCWVEDRPMPPWQIALSIIFAVVVMALCLFPLAPYKLRLAVVYCFLGLLGGIFALILFRFVLFMLVFTVSGYEFWLFPNLLSDQVDILGAFKPTMSFGKPADGQSHLGTRVGGVVSTVLLFYMMYVYSPDEKTIKANLQKAESSILDMVQQVNNPSLGTGSSYEQQSQYGTDRNLDPEKIRRHMMNEKLRKKQERESAKKRGAKGGDAGAGEAEAGQVGSSDAGPPNSAEESADGSSEAGNDEGDAASSNTEL